MSYMEDSIDWQAIEAIDNWLDAGTGTEYHQMPLAQDWARVAKITEEAGEAIAQLILATGQNPRKPYDECAHDNMLSELADVVLTGILAIQHFTKSTSDTKYIIREKIISLEKRARDGS